MTVQDSDARQRLGSALEKKFREILCGNSLKVKEDGFPRLFLEVETYRGTAEGTIAVAINIELCEEVRILRSPQPAIPRGCAVSWQSRLLITTTLAHLESATTGAAHDLVDEFIDDLQSARNYQQRISEE
jgi:hypothetical protein